MNEIATGTITLDRGPAASKDFPELHESAAAKRFLGGSRWSGDEKAVIFRRGRSAMTSGSAGADTWVLRFERRRAPFTEPLMGWTGGDDPLAQVELTFDSRDQAVRYAEVEGLAYRVEREALPATAAQRHRVRQEQGTKLFAAATALAWMDPRYGIAAMGRRPDFDRALMSPASVYACPSEVLHDPSLTTEDKREILRRWAWDAWLLEVAADEAMAGGEPSRLQEVKAALAALGRAETTALLIAQTASAPVDAQSFSGASDCNEFSVPRRQSWGDGPGSPPLG